MINKPKYQIIFEELIEEIKNKDSNDAFYSERELSQYKNISRMTARKIIEKLVEENFLYKVGNIGTFVLNESININVETFSLTNKKLTFKRIFNNNISNDNVLKELDMEQTDKLVKNIYITTFNNEVYSIEEVYFKYDHNDINHMFYNKEYIASSYISNNFIIHQHIKPMIVPANYINWLKVKSDTAITCIISNCYYKDGRKAIFTRSYINPNVVFYIN